MSYILNAPPFGLSLGTRVEEYSKLGNPSPSWFLPNERGGDLPRRNLLRQVPSKARKSTYKKNNIISETETGMEVVPRAKNFLKNS